MWKDVFHYCSVRDKLYYVLHNSNVCEKMFSITVLCMTCMWKDVFHYCSVCDKLYYVLHNSNVCDKDDLHYCSVCDKFYYVLQNSKLCKKMFSITVLCVTNCNMFYITAMHVKRCFPLLFCAWQILIRST